jgi:hypothetical protein
MNKEQNILKTIPTYNSGEVEQTIQFLKKQYEQQQSVQKLLQEDDFDGKAQVVKDFVERNDAEITDQLTRLTTLVEDIKTIVKENEALESDQEEYNELMSDEKTVDVTKNLKKLTELKSEAMTFLERAGIKTLLN